MAFCLFVGRIDYNSAMFIAAVPMLMTPFSLKNVVVGEYTLGGYPANHNDLLKMPEKVKKVSP
jgi:hypothetical protein